MVRMRAGVWDDEVLRFHLPQYGVRGAALRLSQVLDKVFERTSLQVGAGHLLAEATVLTGLIGQAVRLKWKFSLQLRGDGPVKLVAADYIAPEQIGSAAYLRAYIRDSGQPGPECGDAATLLGDGYFGLLIDRGDGAHPYQGITPLGESSLASCAETYFRQSEQLPTRVILASDHDDVSHWRGGGMILQQLPSESSTGWSRIEARLGGFDEAGLIAREPMLEELIGDLLDGEHPHGINSQPVEFGCSCSEERVRRSLEQCTPSEIAGMVTADGVVTADCQFCGARYALDPSRLGRTARDA